MNFANDFSDLLSKSGQTHSSLEVFNDALEVSQRFWDANDTIKTLLENVQDTKADYWHTVSQLKPNQRDRDDVDAGKVNLKKTYDAFLDEDNEARKFWFSQLAQAMDAVDVAVSELVAGFTQFGASDGVKEEARKLVNVMKNCFKASIETGGVECIKTLQVNPQTLQALNTVLEGCGIKGITQEALVQHSVPMTEEGTTDTEGLVRLGRKAAHMRKPESLNEGFEEYPVKSYLHSNGTYAAGTSRGQRLADDALDKLEIDSYLDSIPQDELTARQQAELDAAEDDDFSSEYGYDIDRSANRGILGKQFLDDDLI